MNILILYILNAFIFLSVSAQMKMMTEDETATYEEFLVHQNRLVEKLFESYDPLISPIYTLHASKFINQTTVIHPPVMEMKVTLTMLKLVDVVEVEEKATFLFDYIPEWTDVRLKWNPLEFGGISHIYLPQSKVWMPEISIPDAHDIKNFENDKQKIVWLNYNGTVSYYVATVASVICQLDVFKFPLDEHTCGVSIMYYSYFTNEYRIKSEKDEFIKEMSELGNGEWKVSAVFIEVQDNGPNLSPTQRYLAKFSRNPGFYIALVMIPAYFINLLSIIALFIDLADLQGKFTIGLTNIMAMTFILVILSDDLPKTERIPLLAIYVIISLVIMVAAILVVGVLPYLSKCIKGKKSVNNEKGKSGCFAKIRSHIRIEYIMMAIFQIANLINFFIIFM